jgi:hypothetical protein
MCKELFDCKSADARKRSSEDPKAECSHEAVNNAIKSVYVNPLIMKRGIPGAGKLRQPYEKLLSRSSQLYPAVLQWGSEEGHLTQWHLATVTYLDLRCSGVLRNVEW